MSTITESLVRRATDLAWSNPRGDYQYTFKPSRLSRSGGNIHTLSLPYVIIRLPDTTRRFAVYEMGQFGLWNIGIDKNFFGWKKLSDFVADNNMIVQAFVDNTMLDLDGVFIQRNENQNNLIAIDYDYNKELLSGDKAFYLRFYSNAWFGTTPGQATAGVTWEGRQIAIPQDAADMFNAYATATAGGTENVLQFHNGYLIENLLVAEQNIGDYTQFYQDHSIVDHFDTPFIDIPSFGSARDSRTKGIVTIPDSIVKDISYHDDLEIFVCDVEDNLGGVPRTVGVYYSRLNETNVRQLTQRDYAIDMLRVEQIISEHSDRLDRNTAFIRIYVRNATAPISLPEDGQLLREFYLLSEERRGQLLTGGVSVVDEWRAANLEDSPYLKWMQGDGDYINSTNIKGVFSYHGLNRVAEEPLKLGTASFTLPPSMVNGGRVYNYDATGEMTSSTAVPADALAYAAPAGTESVECIPGTEAVNGSVLESISALTGDPVSSVFESRWYRHAGGEWTLAVEGTDFNYSIDGLTADWVPTYSTAERIRRVSNIYYRRSLILAENDMGKAIDIFAGSAPYMNVPLDRLDVWVNGRRLIENVDFKLDHPRVWLLSRDFYTPGNPIEIEMIYHGASSGLSYSPSYGSIKHRFINYGSPFSLDVYRPRTIIINGLYARTDEVDFSETRLGGMDARFEDGRLYGLLPLINHLPETTVVELTDTPAVAFAKDELLETFLDGELPEADLPGPIIIPGKHGVISPLLTKLIEDLNSGVLDVSAGPTSDAAIAAILSGYSAEQSADTYLQEKFDLDFFEIHPNGRNVSTIVTGIEFAFLEKLNQDMYDGRVDLSSYLTLS